MREEFETLRCRACYRALGISPTERRAYCDYFCAEDVPAGINEDRDALLEAMYQKTLWTRPVLAEKFGVSRQRVDQILNARRYVS